MSDKKALLNELKTHYNKLIKRYKTGADYLDNNGIPLEEREKWMDEFRNIIDGLNGFLKEFKKLGIETTEDEIMNGFELDKL